MSTDFFGSLNGIRALAILAVLWHHADRTESTVLLVLNRGHLGVTLFFLMSGFLIVTLLIREKDRSGDISLVKFYSRRSLRIFPLYYGILLLLSAAFLMKPNATHSEGFFASLPFLLTYTANWEELSFYAIAWSLACEEQFYLVWPVVEKALSNMWHVLAGGVLGGGFILGLTPIRDSLDGGWAGQVSLMWQIAAVPIVLGAVLAHVLNNQTSFRIVYRFVSYRWSPVLGLLAILASASLPSDDPTALFGFPRHAVHIAMAYFVLSCVAVENHSMRAFLSWKPLARIGVVSYGIYLIHILVVPYIGDVLALIGQRRLAELPIVSLVGTLGVSWLLAEVSFRFFEQPVLSLRRHFSVRR